MSRRRLSIGAADLSASRASQRGPKPYLADKREKEPEPADEELTAQWLAGDGITELGDAFRLGGALSVPMEIARPDGTFGVRLVEPGISFEEDIPAGAELLSLRNPRGELLRLNLARLTERDIALPLVQPRYFGSQSARIRFPVFSERFQDKALFEKYVEDLHDWILTVPPFDDPAIHPHFALAAYFWESDPISGLFNTRDIPLTCDSPTTTNFNGDNEIARDSLGRYMLDGRFGLVLINSAVRGGAGGLPDHGCPSWSSIAECTGEKWQAVALHEIGHALGLADEYLLAARAHEGFGREPNCAPDEAARWPVTGPDPEGHATVTLADQQRMAQHPESIDHAVVGVFQGARYRTDFYRPSYNCLMRDTTFRRFCPVCENAIRAALTG